MPLRPRYLQSGHILINPGDDCDLTVDFLLETGYSEDFCISVSFNEKFLGQLMRAGFLVMSMELNNEDEISEPFFILLPKLHLIRSVLFFPELHIKKSIRSLISKYELKVNTDFDLILEKCVETHGASWLTPPLVSALKEMFKNSFLYEHWHPLPISFAVYREGKLKAGEIGIVTGRVYTSYSGYYEEDNSGTVQIILMAQWLEKTGFNFLDFGMPLPYKTALGARDIAPETFVKLFRAARDS
ncbi:MAG: GNAT family N-acetyltransferase [Treponema sp.]|nr:GNAT family N-acetyltransferase [Treponema sp.]